MPLERLDKSSRDKYKRLASLADQRRLAEWTDVRDVSTYHNGAYDCDHVSPYTKGANNVNSEFFVLLQDWCSHNFLINLDPKSDLGQEIGRLGRSPNLPTNKNLSHLLQENFSLRLQDVYATNLFPYIKQGNLNARVNWNFLVRAAEFFALPQIEIVKPKLVICLGLDTFNAIRCSHDLPKCANVDIALQKRYEKDGVHFWAQAHPGHFGQINRKRYTRNESQVKDDWALMLKEFSGA